MWQIFFSSNFIAEVEEEQDDWSNGNFCCSLSTQFGDCNALLQKIKCT